MQKPKYRHYPEPLRRRDGCKVGWNYYSTFVEAEQCSKAAIHNAKLKEELGYDFGYCSPGSIRQQDDGTFEVCLP